MFFSILCLLCLCARLWSPALIGLTSWLSFVVSNCEFVTFPLVSWVRYLIVTIPDLCTLTYFAKDHYSLVIFIGGLDPLPPSVSANVLYQICLLVCEKALNVCSAIQWGQ